MKRNKTRTRICRSPQRFYLQHCSGHICNYIFHSQYNTGTFWSWILHFLFNLIYLGRTVSVHSILYTYDCIFSRAYIESYTLEFIYPGQSSLNEQFFCHLLVKTCPNMTSAGVQSFLLQPRLLPDVIFWDRPRSRISDHYLVKGITVTKKSLALGQNSKTRQI